jgi:hypothetical protein
MRATIETTITCTIEDQFKVLDVARAEVESIRPQAEWSASYPKSFTDALKQLVRTAVAFAHKLGGPLTRVNRHPGVALGAEEATAGQRAASGLLPGHFKADQLYVGRASGLRSPAGNASSPAASASLPGR